MTKTTLSLAAAAAVLLAGPAAMAQMSGAPSNPPGQPAPNPATMGDTSDPANPGPGHLGYKPKPKTQPGDVKSKKSKTSSATDQGADTSAKASGTAPASATATPPSDSTTPH